MGKVEKYETMACNSFKGVANHKQIKSFYEVKKRLNNIQVGTWSNNEMMPSK